MQVKDIEQDQAIQFVTDSQDVQAVKNMVPGASNFDSFFVKVQDGDYSEVYGMQGCVPWLERTIERIR